MIESSSEWEKLSAIMTYSFLPSFVCDFAICLPSPTRLIGKSFLSIIFATVPENDGISLRTPGAAPRRTACDELFDSSF